MLLIAFSKGIFTDVEVREVSEIKDELIRHMNKFCRRTMSLIDSTGELSEASKRDIEGVLDSFVHKKGVKDDA